MEIIYVLGLLAACGGAALFINPETTLQRLALGWYLFVAWIMVCLIILHEMVTFIAAFFQINI